MINLAKIVDNEISDTKQWIDDSMKRKDYVEMSYHEGKLEAYFKIKQILKQK